MHVRDEPEKSIVEHKSLPGEADMGFDDLCSTIDFFFFNF